MTEVANQFSRTHWSGRRRVEKQIPPRPEGLVVMTKKEGPCGRWPKGQLYPKSALKGGFQQFCESLVLTQSTCNPSLAVTVESCPDPCPYQTCTDQCRLTSCPQPGSRRSGQWCPAPFSLACCCCSSSQ